MNLKNKFLFFLSAIPSNIVIESQALYGVPNTPTPTNKIIAIISFILAFVIGILVFIRKKIKKK